MMKTIPIREITPSSSEPKIAQTFRVRKVEAILDGKDMVQDTHRHNFYFVLALQKGRGKHVIDFNPYHVKDNSIFIMRPGQVHQLELKSGSAGYLMEFNNEFYQLNDRGTHQVLKRAASTNLCVLKSVPFENLRDILERIFNEYRDSKEGYHEVIRAHLDIFFIEFVRHRQQVKSPTGKGSPYEQERLEDFLHLVETNISSKKKITEYADMLNLSAYQLSAITKSVLGKTPSDLINEHIVLEAKRYLLAASDQVNQIAWHLGYEDTSYFIRFFKKHTGLSPDAFRTNSK